MTVCCGRNCEKKKECKLYVANCNEFDQCVDFSESGSWYKTMITYTYEHDCGDASKKYPLFESVNEVLE